MVLVGEHDVTVLAMFVLTLVWVHDSFPMTTFREKLSHLICQGPIDFNISRSGSMSVKGCPKLILFWLTIMCLVTSHKSTRKLSVVPVTPNVGQCKTETLSHHTNMYTWVYQQTTLSQVHINILIWQYPPPPPVPGCGTKESVWEPCRVPPTPIHTVYNMY